MGSSFGKGLEKTGSSLFGGGMGDAMSKGAMKLGGEPTFGDKLRTGLNGMNQANSLLGMPDQPGGSEPSQQLAQLMQMLAQKRRY